MFAAIYFVLNWTINEELDEQLLTSQREIIGKFQQETQINYPPFIEIKKVPQKLSEKIVLNDTTFFMKEEAESEPYRQAVAYFTSGGNEYKITVRTSLIERKDLLVSLLGIFALAYLLMVGLLFLINRHTAKKILRPFYYNLDQLKMYSVKSGKELALQKSEIEEFSELNAALTELSSKAAMEYNALREFTGDVSHELQTPVSVVKSKLELLLQKEITDEEMIDHIRKAYQNINRLDRLNRSLVLLAKLESRDFFQEEEISPEKILARVLENYAEIAAAKNISISSELDSGRKIPGNEMLLDILFSNLVSNAVKHNLENGRIEMVLEDFIFTVGNTGKRQALNPDVIFSRFTKGNVSGGSSGLGLSIVKKICLLYNYEINYSYRNELHTIMIKFE
ncbi:MAG: HAMP domain-containing sensor histidine kinase [Calditrichia bacterium]